MRRLQCALLATVAAIGFASIASAADMPTKAPMMAPAVFSWTGFYIGGHAGGAWGQQDWSNIVDGVNFTFTGANLTQQMSGFIGGGQVGYLYQIDPAWVVGVEFSYSGTNLSKSELDIDTPASGAGDRFTSRIRDIFTVTGRLGYTWSDWLLYAKGGYANARVSISANDTISGATFNASGRQDGWTLGAGLDYRLTRNWILGIEYAHYDFGTATYSGTASNGFATAADVNAQADSLVARVNYKF